MPLAPHTGQRRRRPRPTAWSAVGGPFQPRAVTSDAPSLWGRHGERPFAATDVSHGEARRGRGRTATNGGVQSAAPVELGDRQPRLRLRTTLNAPLSATSTRTHHQRERSSPPTHCGRVTSRIGFPVETGHRRRRSASVPFVSMTATDQPMSSSAIRPDALSDTALRLAAQDDLELEAAAETLCSQAARQRGRLVSAHVIHCRRMARRATDDTVYTRALEIIEQALRLVPRHGVREPRKSWWDRLRPALLRSSRTDAR